jgi:hypothetical protein
MEKLFIVHVNSGERMDAGEREKGGGGEEGRGKADPAATLTAALVVFLPNEVVVHWELLHRPMALLILLYVLFLWFFFLFFFSVFFIFASAPTPLCLFCSSSVIFFFHFFPLCSSMFLSILSSLSLPYFLSIFHL